jgi:hypothetical protein
VDRKSGTHCSRFQCPKWCGTMKITTAFSVHCEGTWFSELGQGWVMVAKFVILAIGRVWRQGMEMLYSFEDIAMLSLSRRLEDARSLMEDKTMESPSESKRAGQANIISCFDQNK